MNWKRFAIRAVFFAGAGFIAGLEWPATFETIAPGWTKATSGIRAFADARGLVFFGKPPVVPSGRPQRAVVNVSVEKVQRGPVPYHLESVGTVQPIASVAVRTRIDATIADVLRNDGDRVKAGDVLVKLDDRQLLTQIRQTAALLDKDKTAVEQSARDLSRSSTLLTTTAGPLLNVQNAQTALKAAQAAVKADEAQLDNLNIQESWFTLSAPISGRLGVFTSKVGNIVRSADSTTTGNLVTINQMSPIYVALPLPQVDLAQLRAALAAGPVKVRATPQGGERPAFGEISEIDNIIDPGTGTVTVRAIFPNADELLWPGQLCNVEITLRTDPDDISVSRNATIMVDGDDYVYSVDGGVAHKHRVDVDRFQDGRYIISDGLKGGETVVDDGKDFLGEGSPVNVKSAPAEDGASAP